MLDENTHYGLLKTLEENPDLSQRDLAKRLGVSLGKINFCLNALVAKGSLKIRNFRNNENKLAYAYLLTPRGIEEKASITVRFLKHKMQEYEQLREEIEELKYEVEQKGLLEKVGSNARAVTAQSRQIDVDLREVFARFPDITLALLFGSVASGFSREESDLDIAVAAGSPLSAEEKMVLINALAEKTGRPVDLIDLRVAAEPLLGQVLRHGRRILGSDTLFGELISRHVIEQADFLPYRTRLLAERRMAWIGK
jgi:EPS-associated MarR family transcriptional regulator